MKIKEYKPGIDLFSISAEDSKFIYTRFPFLHAVITERRLTVELCLRFTKFTENDQCTLARYIS